MSNVVVMLVYVEMIDVPYRFNLYKCVKFDTGWYNPHLEDRSSQLTFNFVQNLLQSTTKHHKEQKIYFLGARPGSLFLFELFLKTYNNIFKLKSVLFGAFHPQKSATQTKRRFKKHLNK